MKNIALLVLLVTLLYGGYLYHSKQELSLPQWWKRDHSTATPEVVSGGAPLEAFYNCDEGKTIRARFDGSRAVIALGDTRGLSLTKVASPYGARYETQNGTVLFIEGEGAYLEESGVQTFTRCKAGTPPAATETIKMYRGADEGLTFYYPSLYYLRENEAGSATRPQTALVLVEDTKENRDLLDGTTQEPREGPTSITIDVYSNTQGLSALEWAKQDTNWNIGSKKTTDVLVGGREGVSYTWDGLYPGKSAIVAIGKKAYVFSVTWNSPGDRILVDFEAVLKSAVFSQ